MSDYTISYINKMTEQDINTLLDDLCKSMLIKYNEHVREHYYEPAMVIIFSPDGYSKARSCKEAITRFSCRKDNIQIVNGYPFLITHEQKEDFLVIVMDS